MSPATATDLTLGVLVNPIAGMGGPVGLHGTDGEALGAALAAGAEPVAGDRMRRALTRLSSSGPPFAVLTVAGPMGADLMPPGWVVELIGSPSRVTSAADTHAAVGAMVSRGVSLLLFGGGDGTAQDVAAALHTADLRGSVIPMLGVPSGVKMHSGVFAVSPEAAGDAAARYLAHPSGLGEAEIVDTDGTGTRLFGTAAVPRISGALQSAKAFSTGAADQDLPGLGRAVAAEMESGRLYILGPGSTVAQVSRALGLGSTIEGVDAVLDGRVLVADAGEADLLRLLAAHPRAALILGVVGGQGFLFGRGNQQLSPAVLAAVGPENIEIVAAAGKVAALDPPVLRIDVDDRFVRDSLVGFRRVRTSRQHSTVLQVLA
ncbi:MAG: ATP-NAD kinase family protein [Nakamurella sp.]